MKLILTILFINTDRNFLNKVNAPVAGQVPVAEQLSLF